MSFDGNQFISRYLDDELTEAEIGEFQAWLTADSANMHQFVEASLLHDALHGFMQAQVAIDSEVEDRIATSTIRQTTKSYVSRRAVALLALASTILFVLVLWRGTAPVLAAQAELKKVIAANLLITDRSYTIDAEANQIGGARQRRRSAEDTRPPKPPLNGAKIYVRGKDWFVLERLLPSGDKFITGCDGQSSWAVPPQGAVRVSSNIQEFNRDVPGHEYSMSLCNLTDALTQLSLAYEINVLPIEDVESPLGNEEATRLLVATKKDGFRGPRRVEITYASESRLIEQIRFVDMPYGTDRLTVRMSLLELQQLSDQFFSHAFHHTADRKVVKE